MRGIIRQELRNRVKNAVVPSIKRFHLLDEKQTVECQGIVGFMDWNSGIPAGKTADTVGMSARMRNTGAYIASTVS